MNEDEIKQPQQPQPEQTGQPQAQPPVVESETILVSTRTPLLLENPLTQMGIGDPATFSTLHEKIGSLEEGTFTVSLEDVEAHPFTRVPGTQPQPNPAAPQTPPPTDEPEELVVSKPTPAEVVFADPQPAQTEPAIEPTTLRFPSVELSETKAVPFERTDSFLRQKPEEPVVTPAKPAPAPEPEIQVLKSSTRQEGKQVIKQPETPVNKQSVKPAVPPPNTPDTPPEKPQKRKRWWLWILGILLVLFLGTIGGVVPVENIPVLRTIAHAMGFTPEQAKQMSFLRALLTWTDKTLGLNGRLSAVPQVGESRLFSSRQGTSADGENPEEEGTLGLTGKMARYTGKSSLIDMRALNELQLSKGRLPDQLAGTVLLLPGQKAETRASMRDTDVTVHTEANRDKGEVFFGSDASAINREFEDGYDSIKTLKKVANPHIADGQPIDFLMQMTSRMMKANTGLAGIDKELGTSVVGWQTGPGEVGDNKPLRDLYHAWITSRMSNYTTSIMLKKTLADASFLGAAIPSQASDSLTFGGVRIDSDSLEEDQEGWKEYLEFERKCKAELTEEGHGGPIVQAAVDSFNDLFPETVGKGKTAPENVNFPTNCTDVLKTSYLTSNFYKETVSKIRNACHNMVKGYQKLEDSCKMAVDYETNRCDSNDIVGDVREHYQDRYVGFQKYCEDKYCEEQKKAYEEAHKDDDPPAPDFKCDYSGLSTWSNSGNYKESCATPPCSKDVYFDSQSTADLIKAEVGGTQDYFPQITKDQDYEDDEHRVKTTIVAGIEKNNTL